MRRLVLLPLALTLLSAPTAAAQAAAPDTVRLTAPGLRAPVEIVTDRWGIPHIYAENEPDLFFAQGYNAARDRLFQFEVWRRQATGTVAEILGPREIERDIGTRLFRFRGDLDAELAHYHPRGQAIITSFVRGVNAYITETERDPGLLTPEFRLLGITPGRWTPDVVISRHQGLLGNIGTELSIGRAVAKLGPERVLALTDFGPGTPELALDPAIDGDLLYQDILGLYNAFRRGIRFRPEDVVAAYRGDDETAGRLARANAEVAELLEWRERRAIGSNNWVVSGRLTESGHPIMANDPHRALAAPSLRYWAHLVAPGWNVIGGGEPVLPGLSIGHNGYGAWGLTVFATDGEDLYVYETNPGNPNQYRYDGRWEDMRVIRETIPVEGQAPVTAELKYTRHGPVVYEDEGNDVAYAIRAAWMEIGGAPYLASLRMDQARSWAEFREACSYSHIPGENMVWMDRDGNIGWQAVGIAPIRRTWSGLVPVPGDGRYEWDGYLPIRQLPHVLNPPSGYIATANNELIPDDYPHRDAVGWSWSDPYRLSRIDEALGSGRKLSMADMLSLQTDVLSLPARTLVPMLRPLAAGEPGVEDARRRLLEWDHRLEPGSVAAGIYVAWEDRLRENIERVVIPLEARDVIRGLALSRVIEALQAPDRRFGDDPAAARDALLLASLDEAVAELRQRLGADMDGWRYGQPDYKHVTIRHPMSGAVTPELRAKLDVGTLPRGGYGNTVNSTGGADNQSSGASFRIVATSEDWDLTMGTNAPGQSGDPDHPHYRDLFELWGTDRFFPAFYTRERIDSVADRVTVLVPAR
ncbi:MAG: penicillin acylase family protein [Gemmatimonadetes bacterium]|nr:penicillin acylase family protein [Gemmatimonadota bacterium]